MVKNVLILHEIPDRYYFRDIAKAYRDKGCNVTVFCPDRDAYNYRHCFKAGVNHLLYPDFTHPESWESDANETARLTKLINRCEAVTGRALGRILVAGERNLSRAWTEEEYYWHTDRISELTTNDPTMPERIALRFFRFWETAINEYNFDLVLGRSPCNSVAQSLHMLCALKDIPFLYHKPSKMHSGRMFWTDDLLMDNARGRELYEEKAATNAPLGEAGRSRLQAFKNAPSPSGYILDNWRKLDKQNIVNFHLAVLQRLREWLRHYRKRFRGLKPKPVLSPLLEAYHIEWCKKAHAKYFQSFTTEELASIRYVLYPLHKEPELMLNYRAPLWHNQRHAIKFIGSMIPAGYSLMVREHKGNWGRRFGRWLQHVSRFPRTILTHPYDLQFPYIANADLIITDNGTAGWEGIMMGKPVVTVERNFYDPVGIAVKCHDINRLDASILKALSSKMSDEEREARICRFLDADYETTMDTEKAKSDMATTIAYIDTILMRRR